MKVRCPRCGREASTGSENRFRPFCCERCRMIDLGHWVSGDYHIPVRVGDEEEDVAPPSRPPETQDK